MPLPISSNVFIPNPLTPIRAAESGFNIGKQSSDFANITEGVFKGIGFVDQLATNQNNRDNNTQRTEIAEQQRQQQAQNDAFNQQLNTRKTDQIDTRIANEEQRTRDIRANNIATDARIRSNNAIRRKEEVENAELQSSLSGLLADGNPDSFIALTNDPQKRGKVLTALMDKENRGLAQKAVEQLRADIINGKVPPESLPEAKVALKTLESSPDVKSINDVTKASADTVFKTTGFTPDKNTTSLALEPGTREIVGGGGLTVAGLSVRETRADGTTRDHPYLGKVEDKETFEMQKAINAFNQQKNNVKELEAALNPVAKQKADTATQGDQQAAPAKVGGQRQNLGTLATAPDSLDSDPGMQPVKPVDAIRQKLRTGVTNGQ